MSVKEPLISLRVRAITYQGEGTNAYELVDPGGGELPAFAAGAHIDVHLPRGMVRQYSLCNPPAERHRFVLCVQREHKGRGGSKAIHETVSVGQILEVSSPRNNFPLASDATRHVLLAGGIGITPMIAMLHTLRSCSATWHLTYCTRASESTAFLEELAPDIKSGQVTVHHDQGQPENSLDLRALLFAYEPGTHLYYCGPTGFMAAAADACAHWPAQAVHVEHFSVPEESSVPASGDDSFQIKINSTGAVFDVPEGKSIVAVLAENDINVETSCEAGLCGTCQTNYLDGQPDHRDHILGDEDKTKSVLICCARSLSPLLVLDL